ncbi:MAG: 5'-nucleotidase C-terminal domain-containing protein [Vicinamibacteria bacterium]|nr:5'-nucleotidase C-terminal domain-containing protein [Vicinamibacteria bacterium]
MKRIRTFRAAFIIAGSFLCSSAVCSDNTTVTILHINDLHGWLVSPPAESGTLEAGGMARLASEVKKERTPNTLFVAAGDLMQGARLSNSYLGRPVIEALNLMGLDATAIGNHEFDFGLDVLRQRISEAGFPFLAANIEGSDIWSASAVRRIGAIRVALFGLTTTDTVAAAHPRNVSGLTFQSAEEVAKKIVGSLRPQADVIVLLSHLGFEVDEKLAAAVPGIDVIVGGHTHTKIEKPVRVGGTLLVQAYEKGKCLGRLDLRFEGARIVGHDYRLISITPESGSDATVAALVERYCRDLDRKLSEPVGTAGVELIGERERMRTGETNLGDLVADVMRKASGAEIAIMNSGGIRSGILAGVVTVGAVYDALPFDTHIISVSLFGREVREALEVGVSRVEESDGGFPQVSGLTFTLDRSAPAGRRVLDITVGGAPLDEDRQYVVATNDFLAAGGDDFNMFVGRATIFDDSGRYLRDVVADHWRQAGRIDQGVEGRILEAK